jgi:hypothetical protein
MNVKPGMMAKIVEPHFRHGAIVEVLRDTPAEEKRDLVALDFSWAECGHIWYCRLMTGSRSIDCDTGKARYLYPGDECWVADQYLRPITDPDDGIDEEVVQVLPIPSKAVPA